MTTRTLSERRRPAHQAHEVCQNTDRSRNYLAMCEEWIPPEQEAEEAATCWDCGAQFDDPEHGRFSRCTAKRAHVCRFDPR